MRQNMLHGDKRCCGVKKAEVSDRMQVLLRVIIVLNWVTQTGFIHGRLSTRSPTMSSWKHLSYTWVKMMPMDLTTIVIMMDGKHWSTCAADGDVSCLLHHVAWI